MAKMQEFKCPCCGGSIEFDSSVQKMKCPFCDTEFDVGTLSEYAQTVEEEQPEDMSWSDEAGSEWQDGESEGLRTYVCKSCGGDRGRCQHGSNGLPVLRKSGGNDRAAVRCTEAGLCDPV